MVSAGLIAVAGSGLPGEEDLEVPTLLSDEEEEDTVALDFGIFFLGFSAAFAA